MDLPDDVEELSEISWDDAEDATLYDSMVADARSFLEGFAWCASVRRLLGGEAVPGVIAVFFAEIAPTKAGVDRYLWVVVGDVPPAYLVVDRAPTSLDALAVYIELMRQWITAVHAGETVSGLVPVNADPTAEIAEMLGSRLDFLQREILQR